MSTILRGTTAQVEGSGAWLDQAARTLAATGADVRRDPGSTIAAIGIADHRLEFGAAEATSSESDWAACGAMALTGWPDGPPLLIDVPVASAMRAAAGVFALLSSFGGGAPSLDGPALLGERAACAELRRRGPESPGGHCRLIQAEDGWFALSLARAADIESVPALVEAECEPYASEAWEAVREAARRSTARELVARARMLGMCASELPTTNAPDVRDSPPGASDADGAWLVTPADARVNPRVPATSLVGALVVDCSALWAGPLCAHLLGLSGARVVKVEDPSRPDGARMGPPPFFDLLHAGHAAVALDLAAPEDRRRLVELLEHADVVIESTRPRAFDQLGIDRTGMRRADERVWVSITGYGTTGAGRNWPALGDDAAVGAGLVAWTARGPVIVGDAIADPLTGIHAAIAVAACRVAGRGAHIDISLHGVVRSLVRQSGVRGASQSESRLDGERWVIGREGESVPVLAPRARTPSGRAPRLGEHTAAVLADLHIR